MAMTLADRLIGDAMNLSGVLSNTADNLTLAIEQEAVTRRAEKEARQAYESMEAEVVFDAMTEANGRNAESRKAEVEAKLAAARGTGPLAWAWAQMNAAAQEHEHAVMALEQMKTQFRATDTAAMLQSAMLRAIAPR